MNIDIDQRFCCKRENTIPFVLCIHIKAKYMDTFLGTLLDLSLFIFETHHFEYYNFRKNTVFVHFPINSKVCK